MGISWAYKLSVMWTWLQTFSLNTNILLMKMEEIVYFSIKNTCTFTIMLICIICTICMYVYMIICIGASRMAACELLCVTAKSQHLLPSSVSSTPYFMRQGLSLNLKLIVLVRLTGQKTPCIFLSLPPQPWDYRCTQPFLPFYVGNRDLNSDHHAFMTNTIQWIIFPSPWILLIIWFRWNIKVYSFLIWCSGNLRQEI